jgi:hypothetical protein
MSFLALLAVFIASSIVAILLRPKIEKTDSPGDFRPPEPREGEPIPVVWGTVKVSPAVTWFGDVEAERVTKKQSSFFGLVTDEIPLGWEYFAGMQLLLCHGPIDKLLDIHIGEYHVASIEDPRVEGVNSIIQTLQWLGRSQNQKVDLPQLLTVDGAPTALPINLPQLFGGKEEGGGIVGTMDIHWGSESQAPNDYLAVWWGADILSQYRGTTYVVLRRMNMGKNPSPSPWHFVVVRIPDGLGQSAYATITDGDGNETANPAECIYELATNTRWGAGQDPDTLDLVTFQDCAQTLYTEGMGYNGQMIQRAEAATVARQILSHVNGVLYQDPLTGLIGMKLIREDYVIGNLPEFTESNAVLDEFTRGSWGEVINETSVAYTDIGRRFSEGTAQAQNLAAIQAMGEIISTQIDLPGFSTHELAADAAARSNRATSVPLARGRLVATRYAYDLHQGSPFKITFPHHEISGLVCRVTSINYGSLLEGRIEIEFVADPFNHLNPYGSPSQFIDNTVCGPLSLYLNGYNPAADPAANFGDGRTAIFEVPYWHLGNTERRAWAFVSRKTNQELYYYPYISEHGAPFVRSSTPQYLCVLGILEADLSRASAATVTSLTVRNMGDMEALESTDAAGRVAGKRLAIIDNGKDQEIIAWETVTDNDDGTFTLTNVMRGVLDTTPLEHLAGSQVLFYWNENVNAARSAADITGNAYSEGTSVAVRPARVDIDGTEEEPSKEDMAQAVMTDRAGAPYPPGKVTLNSNEYPAWPATTSGDVTLGWTHRSRTLQTTIVAQDDATSYTLEGTLTIEVLLDGKPVREWTGVTGTSQVYTWAQRQADDADLTKKAQFRITPVGSGSEEGIARTTPTFTMGA